MKIKIIKGVAIKSVHQNVGDVIDVENNLALQLMGMGKAKVFTEKKKPEVREKDLKTKIKKR